MRCGSAPTAIHTLVEHRHAVAPRIARSRPGLQTPQSFAPAHRADVAHADKAARRAKHARRDGPPRLGNGRREEIPNETEPTHRSGALAPQSWRCRRHDDDRTRRGDVRYRAEWAGRRGSWL